MIKLAARIERHMKQELTKNIMTKKGVNEFQVRLLKDEGVGLLTTKNEENFLILDSIDYWFDLIQQEYPKKKKCSCKNEWFTVSFSYIPRERTEDIREVKIITTCTKCSKVSKPISIDINYSPTKELIKNPITFCENPNIKYKIQELTSFWSGENLKDFLQFIFQDLNLNVYCWFSQHPDNNYRFEKVTFDKAMQIITVYHKYLAFIFSSNELNTENYIILNESNGVYLKNEIWKRGEIIELSFPYVMIGYELLYYIKFCNQYLDKGNVKDKSEQFENITTKLRKWLKDKFINKRGTNCFDGQEAYDKFLNNRHNL